MKEKATSGFVIAKADESEPDILVDELHPCVCPNCGISKFEEGHEKDIVYDDFDSGSISTRCWGGFGEKRYKYLPHKCKACGTVFAPWIVEKKVNGDVIGHFIGLMISVLAAISATVVSAAIDYPILLLGTVAALIFMACCIAGIECGTCDVCNPEESIHDELKYAEITGKYFEDDETESLDSALQHIKEVLGEDEIEDLNVTFDGVSMKQAASACKDLATANMSEPKSAMEVFDTLTPEQKAVAYYLMGGAVMASEEEILAMRHIQDQVQANAAKRMNDIWRLHV